MARNRIMVVDDEESMREFLCIMLRNEGYDVVAFPAGGPAIEHFKENHVDLVIADLKMPGMSGVNLLKALKEISPDVVFIMITAYASVDSAVEAMKAGAYDYFTKPFNIEEIKLHIKRSLEWRRLERENMLLKKDLKTRYGFSNLVGTSPKMVEVYEFIMSIAGIKTNVLITGESGTGKELVARAIHDESPRKDNPFVSINCGAIPDNLLESELFGHVKGAFTGAVSDKAGLAEMGGGGTIFLDEITELPFNLQVKLLRFLQERNVRRVGGTADIPVDIRVIAATNRDMEEEVRAGRFREDLFYRLNVLHIDLPPLRERREDIPRLAEHFLQKYSAELEKGVKRISEEALNLLVDYDYPGNVRELENAIERAVALETGESITADTLPPAISKRNGAAGFSGTTSITGGMASGTPLSNRTGIGIPPEGIDLERAVSEFERSIIMEALEKAGGVKKKAARLLGISFRSMRYKLSKYDKPK